MSITPYSLKFKHPFGVSGNVRTETPAVFIKLENDGVCGYGEACLPPYLGETVQQTVQFLNQSTSYVKNFGNDLPVLQQALDNLHPECNAAKAALDIALNDLLAKRENKTFAEFKGIPTVSERLTSFTIGIDSEEVIVQKLEEANDFKILKIKAGTPNDKALIKLIRRHTDKPLYVDVNQGWKDKQHALEMACLMADNHVLLLEQPMPKEMIEDMKWLTARSPLPTIADESAKRLKDIKNLHGAFSGVNIKLMKCTGLNEALGIIDYCRQNGLKVLLGCMAESSCATSAMAQLMALADYIDLDAPQLYTNDPFNGVSYLNGSILTSQQAGTGALPVKDFVF